MESHSSNIVETKLQIMNLTCSPNTLLERQREKRLKDTIGMYRRVLNNIRKSYKMPMWKVQKAVNILNANSSQKVDFDRLQYCIAYMICYSPCYTELAFKHMFQFLEQDIEAMTAHGSDIKIISIDGGPGHDVIGFINAICEKLLAPEKLKVTVVDKVIKWQMFFSVVISEVLAWGEKTLLSKFFNEVELAYDFIHADIEKWDTNRRIIEAVENANLVIVFNIFNISKEKRKDFENDMAKSMKGGALLYLGNVEESTVADSEVLGENFSIIYCGYEAGVILPKSTIMNCKCRQLCEGHAVILRKRETAEKVRENSS